MGSVDVMEVVWEEGEERCGCGRMDVDVVKDGWEVWEWRVGWDGWEKVEKWGIGVVV